MPVPSIPDHLAEELDHRVTVHTPAAGFRTGVAVRQHTLVADEPVEVGGTDEGPTPYDLLGAALGTCTAMTLRMYADRKEWPLQGITVHVEHDRLHAADCATCETEDGHIDRLTGGVATVFDCVGTSDSITESLAVVRPRGRVVMVGMPGSVSVDLTGLWHREIELVGAYAYGTELTPDGPTRTFDLAFDLVRHADLGRLVSVTYPLARYRDAIEHAANAGPRGAVKVAFDLRDEKERNRL